MPLLSTSEAFIVSDSFLSSLYGDEIFRKWKKLKVEMKFHTEREYVSWLIDVANHYRSEDEQLPQETDTDQFTTSNVKSEECLDHYNQGEGQAYETPGSQYSHFFSTTEDTKNSKNNVVIYYPKTTTTTKNSQKYSEQFTVDTKVEGAVNSDEQTSVTSQVDDYKYEQSYYDEGREDANMPEMERNEEILLSSDDEGEGDGEAGGAMDDGNALPMTGQLSNGLELESVLESSNKRHKCPHCSYSSSIMGNLKRHTRTVHERRKPFSCPCCDYKFSLRATLKAHLINRHGHKSKYCCQNCRKYFANQSHLHKHYMGCTNRGN